MDDIFDIKGIQPMLIAEQVDPYNDTDSIFELKLDGLRCIAYCDLNETDLRNKRNMKLLPRFPELKDIYKSCKEKCILDGELIVTVDGKPDFYELQRRSMLSDPFKMQLSYMKYPASFVAYDILYYKDHETVDLPLMERKKILDRVILESNILSISRFIEENGIALFELAKQQQLEGVVGKKKESLYWYGKRTKDWKKIKFMADYEAIAIGYIPKQNNMTSLVLAKYNEDNELVLTNHVTLGVSLTKLREQGLKVAPCPFRTVPKGHEDAVWIQPMVCTVEYMPSEKEGLRQAVFKGIRDDKLPEECRI
jgi:ATP-dependent DNA ligase